MHIIIGILKESYDLLNAMSLYLLFGFLFAGVIHIFLDTGFIARHLGKSDLSAVIKSSLFGIPLPLCSCGVIPAAMSLKKEGASNGAILSFLISTPTTGIDSICVTYSLLGPFFTVFRILAAFFTAVFAGILSNVFDAGNKNEQGSVKRDCKLCRVEEQHKHTFSEKLSNSLSYAFVGLLRDVGNWIILGIFIGGCIGYFIPEGFIGKYLSSDWQAMALMLLVGIPMYVCATGSIPIAAALVLKGLSPAAAFVFLMAGSATNTVTMTVIAKNLGKKQLLIYIFSIVVMGLSLGYLLNILWQVFNMPDPRDIFHHINMLPKWIEVFSSAVLLFLILLNTLRSKGVLGKKY